MDKLAELLKKNLTEEDWREINNYCVGLQLLNLEKKYGLNVI